MTDQITLEYWLEKAEESRQQASINLFTDSNIEYLDCDSQGRVLWPL